MTRFIASLACVAALLLPPSLRADVTAPSSQLARIKDMATVKGIRKNQLVGYGIVVGLRGSGDSRQTTFPCQTLIATLQRMGVTVPQGQGTGMPRLRNMAAVFITATLPPFAEPGNKIDVIVSSAGDARSIEGGMLLMTPLYGPDGRIYAQAQGPVVLGGDSVQANGNRNSADDPTIGHISTGAIVERTVPLHLDRTRKLTLLLNDPDFRTAELMSSSINKTLGWNASHALDSRRIEIRVSPKDDIPELLARVESIEVQVFPRARVVVNKHAQS